MSWICSTTISFRQLFCRKIGFRKNNPATGGYLSHETFSDNGTPIVALSDVFSHGVESVKLMKSEGIIFSRTRIIREPAADRF
jgi:hypothetical protein